MTIWERHKDSLNSFDKRKQTGHNVGDARKSLTETDWLVKYSLLELLSYQFGHPGSGGIKGGHGGIPPSEVLPPLSLSQKNKMVKISHFWQIFGFYPLRNAFFPLDAPHEKNSGAATASWTWVLASTYRASSGLLSFWWLILLKPSNIGYKMSTLWVGCLVWQSTKGKQGSKWFPNKANICPSILMRLVKPQKRWIGNIKSSCQKLVLHLCVRIDDEACGFQWWNGCYGQGFPQNQTYSGLYITGIKQQESEFRSQPTRLFRLSEPAGPEALA